MGRAERMSLLDFISVFGKITNMDIVFKALADPTRRRILQLLREREFSAGELSEHFAISKPTLSGHFAVLRAADLVATERSGTTILYRLNASVLEEALLGFAEVFGIGVRGNPGKVFLKGKKHG